MSKPRPGVAAAKRLAKCTDPKLWELVESQYSEVVPHVKGLKTAQVEYRKLGRLFLYNDSKDCITKEELLKIVAWKFSVGKPRHALMKHLESNTEASVRAASKSGIATARDITTKCEPSSSKNALEVIATLKGVGPATASALLALVRPDVFCYMYDEVLDCCLPKRAYTLPAYRTLNEFCLGIAEDLGKGWTTYRVASVLWTAARANAYGLEDHTLAKRPMADASNTTPRTRKRQKK